MTTTRHKLFRGAALVLFVVTGLVLLVGTPFAIQMQEERFILYPSYILGFVVKPIFMLLLGYVALSVVLRFAEKPLRIAPAPRRVMQLLCLVYVVAFIVASALFWIVGSYDTQLWRVVMWWYNNPEYLMLVGVVWRGCEE